MTLPALGQSPETGGDSDDDSMSNAQRARPLGDPGAAQDAEDAREKLLKASDQIDQVETNSEATKAAVDSLKTQLAQMEADNAALKTQVSALQDTVTHQQEALDQIKADRAKERQAIIDEVAALVAAKPAHHSHAEEADTAPATRKPVADDETASPSPSLSPPPDPSDSGPVKVPADAGSTTDSASPTASTDATPTPPPATPRPHKGYYHVVAPHETLSLICEAYRDHGVKVTVAEIRRANGLTSKSPLKVGQKLFIPKPGT